MRSTKLIFMPITPRPLVHINQQIAKDRPKAFDIQVSAWQFPNSAQWYYQFHCLPMNTKIIVKYQYWMREVEFEAVSNAVGEVIA
jgi:hypothetical protein